MINNEKKTMMSKESKPIDPKQLKFMIPLIYAVGWLTGGQLQTGIEKAKGIEGATPTGLIHFVALFVLSAWLIARAMKLVAVALKGDLEE